MSKDIYKYSTPQYSRKILKRSKEPVDLPVTINIDKGLSSILDRKVEMATQILEAIKNNKGFVLMDKNASRHRGNFIYILPKYKAVLNYAHGVLSATVAKDELQFSNIVKIAIAGFDKFSLMSEKLENIAKMGIEYKTGEELREPSKLILIT